VSGPLRGPSGGWHAFPRPHEAYGLCALGLPQVKAVGLGVVFDHYTPIRDHFTPSGSDGMTCGGEGGAYPINEVGDLDEARGLDLY